ncbi:EAL domain-containing protein [Chromatiaceae bacterium AAb-1]|nr:EAL domain-containing protein [Chromatiaceae bacterium AAb-1]
MKSEGSPEKVAMLQNDQEQQLLALSVKASKAAILITDAETNIIYANNGLSQLLGYSPKQLIGKSALTFIHRQNKRIRQQLARIQQGISYEDSLQLMTSDGQPRWVNITASPVFGEDHNLINVVTILTENHNPIHYDTFTILQNRNLLLLSGKTSAREQMILKTALDNALDNNELYLLFQPQLRMDNPRILSGVEALARWYNPQLGQIPPILFIPLAEECGLINKLSNKVLDMACQQLKRWRNQALDIPRVSINLSPLNFQDKQLTASLTSLLNNYQLQATDFCLEITENILLDHHSDDTDKQIKMLSNMGFKIAIDDFGTGYSNLSYLRYLPVSELKLDKSFVDGLTEEPASQALSKAILGIGNSLNLQVIAEGIETAAQYDILRQQGYHTGQGYLFSEPLTADELSAWLVKH